MKVIFPITPQTHVRATQGDAILFRIPKANLRAPGLKRRSRLEKYNEYKASLLAIAKAKGYNLPAEGLVIRFFVPIPKSWSKKKRVTMHGKPHQQRPDIDNYLKSIFDSLLLEDNYIANISEVTKRWVDHDSGWIELDSVKPVYEAITVPLTRDFVIYRPERQLIV